MARKEKLVSMLELEPGDPFLHYALAQEYLKAGDLAQGKERLSSMLEQFPAYHAAHFRLGQLLGDEGQLPEARDVLRLGIDVANTDGDQHAVSEMTGLLEMLGETEL